MKEDRRKSSRKYGIEVVHALGSRVEPVTGACDWKMLRGVLPGALSRRFQRPEGWKRVGREIGGSDVDVGLQDLSLLEL